MPAPCRILGLTLLLLWPSVTPCDAEIVFDAELLKDARLPFECGPIWLTIRNDGDSAITFLTSEFFPNIKGRGLKVRIRNQKTQAEIPQSFGMNCSPPQEKYRTWLAPGEQYTTVIRTAQVHTVRDSVTNKPYLAPGTYEMVLQWGALADTVEFRIVREPDMERLEAMDSPQ